MVFAKALKAPAKAVPNANGKCSSHASVECGEMWERGEKYFTNMTFTEEMGNKTNRWIPLEGTSVVQARTQY